MKRFLILITIYTVSSFSCRISKIAMLSSEEEAKQHWLSRIDIPVWQKKKDIESNVAKVVEHELKSEKEEEAKRKWLLRIYDPNWRKSETHMSEDEAKKRWISRLYDPSWKFSE